MDGIDTREGIRLRDGGTVVLKHYEHRPGLEGLKRLLPHGAAQIEWDQGVALKEAGIPCAEPLAFGRAPVEGENPAAEILVTGRINEARELQDWWSDPALGPRDRRELVRAFAGLVRRTHDAGIVHEDPHLGNFLARRGDDDRWQVFPIDLRRVKSKGRLGPTGRDAHLLLLYQTMGGIVSRTDRLRFLSTYLEHADGAERRGLSPAACRRGVRQHALRYRAAC